jgi:hypothetical protein
VRKTVTYLSLKKESGKNLAFESYKSPNFVYRGKNFPIKKDPSPFFAPLSNFLATGTFYFVSRFSRNPNFAFKVNI